MNNVDIAFKVLKLFKDNNIDAYLVGGTSRDYLLYGNFSDIDICSKGLPSVNEEILKDYEMSNKDGKFYGVLKYKVFDREIEITTLRKEGEYIKNRRPKTIEFIDSLYLDSLRRDFTINAIYIDAYKNVYDYHNGVNDLNNKVIRMIGDPLKRINEDALRILRAIRFSSYLNFEIEENLKETILSNYNLVYSLNKNTLRKEINKFLLFKDIKEVEDLFSKFNLKLGDLYEY
jgi:tRNA nucleotidyltransferase (CCA-adding enzyme)